MCEGFLQWTFGINYFGNVSLTMPAYFEILSNGGFDNNGIVIFFNTFKNIDIQDYRAVNTDESFGTKLFLEVPQSFTNNECFIAFMDQCVVVARFYISDPLRFQEIDFPSGMDDHLSRGRVHFVVKLYHGDLD